MTLNELCNELKKFPPYEKQSEGYIIDSITKLCDDYIKLLREVEDSAFESLGTNKTETLNIVSDVKEIILKSINDYLCGKPWKATDNIYQKFFNKDDQKNKIVLSGNISNKELFYRMRSCETSYLYQKEKMFHIPFELRGKVENQRYSMSGYPCLYIGSSLYVCWEELNRPNIDTSNMTIVDSERELFFVNMKMPSEITKKDHLYKIPHVIACALKVNDHSNTFKVEYVIPQIILQCVVKRNMNGGVKIKSKGQIEIDGIMYTSTHFSDENRLFDNIDLYTNYVIPVKTSAKEGLCPDLCETFKISKETISPNILKIYNSWSDQENVNQTVYEKSLFGMVEEWLKNKDKVQLKPKSENKKTIRITKGKLDAVIEHVVQERLKKS